MNFKIIFQLVIVSTIISCTGTTSKTNKTIDMMDANEWFENGEWREGLKILPDESINKMEFFTQYNKNKELWEAAFEYLKTADLSSLEPGRIDFKGDSLFAIVSEYQTRSLEESAYEAHRKYADIQYLISGEEKMGVIGLEKTETTIPYDETKDIAFMTAPDENLRMANNKVFFIFFPEDAHRPCMMIDEKKPVRKIVFKVRVD